MLYPERIIFTIYHFACTEPKVHHIAYRYQLVLESSVGFVDLSDSLALSMVVDKFLDLSNGKKTLLSLSFFYHFISLP